MVVSNLLRLQPTANALGGAYRSLLHWAGLATQLRTQPQPCARLLPLRHSRTTPPPPPTPAQCLTMGACSSVVSPFL
jgi:hypothetical protein